jgi:hypothetical protein
VIQKWGMGPNYYIEHVGEKTMRPRIGEEKVKKQPFFK